MNESYWMGVLSVPALVLAVLTGWVAFKVVAHVAERVFVGGIQRITPDAKQSQRVAVSSVMYSAKRAWMFARGDVGVVLIVGMDGAKAAEASKRLNPPVSLRDLKRRTASDRDEAPIA